MEYLIQTLYYFANFLHQPFYLSTYPTSYQWLAAQVKGLVGKSPQHFVCWKMPCRCFRHVSTLLDIRACFRHTCRACREKSTRWNPTTL